MIVNISDNVHSHEKRLTPALYRLLEACLEKKTTNTKVLAAHLCRSPATIRTEFQRVLAFMDVHCRYEALRAAEENGLIRRKRR
ncbi:response regulator transcription factor [Nitrosomonas sp. Nm58]|uniref:response regulator transcription factor n=1 Tax=Nitrosomonas sp. Nm58 TaxID=200126 RepID=UPI00089D9164|nr:response regulator transcription factor [Nitrosomonas sp. Nm58]SDY07950.1 hypothetical protein SAMN05421754_1001287 [Nitrosomonas sp. Nm58]